MFTIPRICLVVAAFSGAIKLALVWTGWPETSILADDAFYYFTIAHNLAQGLGPTFDTLTPTNGFHPAWQYALVPLWQTSPDLWIPIRLALSSTVVLDLASAWLIHHTVTRRAGSLAAAFATIFWLLHPVSAFLGLRGMESSLSTFLILLTFAALLRARSSASTWRWALMLGGLVGLCGLARTDNLVTVGLALAVATMGGFFPRLVTNLQRSIWLAVTGLVSLAVMLPWFVWNVRTFGHVVQVSGRVKYYTDIIAGKLPEDWSSATGALETIAYAVFAPLLTNLRWLAGEAFGDVTWLPYLAPAHILVASVALFFAYRSVRGEPAESRHWVSFPVTYVLLHTVLFGFVWRSYSGWYALPTFGFVAIFTGVGLAHLCCSRPRWFYGTSIATAGLIGLGTVLLFTQHSHGAKGVEDRYDPLLQRCLAQLPNGGTVGAWDAGAIGYTALKYDSIRVTNLDCLVNNAAFDAVRERRYDTYLINTVDMFVQPPRRARMFLDPVAFDRFLQMTGHK